MLPRFVKKSRTPPVEFTNTIPNGEKIRVIPESTEENEPFDLKNKRLKMIMSMLKKIKKETFFIVYKLFIPTAYHTNVLILVKIAYFFSDFLEYVYRYYSQLVALYFR